jgi:hypothetical protein
MLIQLITDFYYCSIFFIFQYKNLMIITVGEMNNSILKNKEGGNFLSYQIQI